MARTIEVVPSDEGRPRRVSPPRRTRVVVRKVGPWSVLRFSLLFYFCLMIAMWIGFIILYDFLGAIGVLHSIEHGIRGLGSGWKDWSFHAGWIFSRMFMIGLVMVVFGAIVNLFAAYLYNLIADFVGGIELTLTERR
jgi:transmembrane protein DUF3566